MKRALEKNVPRVLALLAAAFWVLPYAWMTATSFKPQSEIASDPTAPLPKAPQLDGYREVFQLLPVGRFDVERGWFLEIRRVSSLQNSSRQPYVCFTHGGVFLGVGGDGGR